MKRCLTAIVMALWATVAFDSGQSNQASAQGQASGSSAFYGGEGTVNPQTMPPYPAAPLAGGYPAAQGGCYMDAHGQPIVMPASYCQGYPPDACYGGGYGADGGGDPMAVDFGGYGHDQCGPHYFDVAFETVWLRPEELFATGVLPFTSVGIGSAPNVPAVDVAPPQLNPVGEESEYEPGWSIAVRYDLGALSVLEATYMGLYDIGFTQTASSVELSGLGDQLFSVFSQYGFDPAVPIVELDEANFQSLEYQSDLQSTELSYRRYWVAHNTCTSGTYLLGARYVRLTEDLTFSSITDTASGSVFFNSSNDLVGFQLGGDSWTCVWQGARVGFEGKAGVYNNRFEYSSGTTVTSVDSNFAPPADGNTVSFIGEGDASFVIDILPSWSLRGGYKVIYLSSIVLVGDNLSTSQFSSIPVDQPALTNENHAFYHGFHAGLEYIW